METSEGIEVTLTFGHLRKEGSFTFTKFDSEEFLNFVQKICKEFIADTELDHSLFLSPNFPKL